jgi:hypothetical protein
VLEAVEMEGKMKKMLFALIAVVFVSSLCFAQEVSAPSRVSNTTASVKVKIETFIGDVILVSIGNAGTNSKILVRDDNGKVLTFRVTAYADIIDKNGNPTTLDWTENKKVAIKYTVNDENGTRMVRSIKVLPD